MYKNFKTNDKVFLVRHSFYDPSTKDDVREGKITLKGARKIKICVDGFDLVFKDESFTASTLLGVMYTLYKSEKEAYDSIKQKELKEKMLHSIMDTLTKCNNEQLENILYYLQQV